jgi:hypothetical protein
MCTIVFCYTLSFLYICICKSEFKTYSFFSAYFNKYVLIYCSVKWIPYLFSLRDIVNIENGLCKKEIGDTKGTIVNRKSKKCRCNWSNERGQQENNGAHHTTWALIMCYALFMCLHFFDLRFTIVPLVSPISFLHNPFSIFTITRRENK